MAIVKKFAENNIFPVIIGRDKQKLEQVQNELGEKCATISFDLNVLSEIPEFIEGIIKKYERIDILVNNAGINMKKEFTDVTDDDFQKILHTNVTSVFAISREVGINMIENKKGCIINISSMAALMVFPR